jgi:hypothetical protein
MLISMPTDTSTIFGVFQAIGTLLAKPDEIRPRTNLAPNKKFASEIFAGKPVGHYAAVQGKWEALGGMVPKRRPINGFRSSIPTGCCRGVDIGMARSE